MFPVFLILTSAALTACVMSARAAQRARRESRPTRHLTLLAATFGLLCLALPVHAYGQMTMFYFMIDEQCPARGAGAFIEFHQSLLPIRGDLECTERTIRLVPAWINPTVSTLLAAAIFTALATSITWQRSRRMAAAP